MATTTDHPATEACDARDMLSETVATIDALLAQAIALAEQIATARNRLDDLAAERRLREARATLEVEGKNENERTARLRLALASDGDYRALVERERASRIELARLEAKAWAARMRVHTCLALLRLAGTAEGEDGDAEASVSAVLPGAEEGEEEP